MDEDRIRRIARAMCRAARLDPDKPAERTDLFAQTMEAQGQPQPAWMLFRQDAARFAMQNREIVQSL